MDPDLREQMRKLAEEVVNQHPGASIAELNQFLSELSVDYNNMGQPEMAGLSPQQVQKLLYGGWDGPDAGLHIKRNLTLDDLSGSDMLANGRSLLTSIRDQGGVKATASGNLNRAFVIEMTNTLHVDPFWKLHMEGMLKSIKEEEVLELNILRHVLQIAGLIRKTKGRFHVTKKGAPFIADDKAGELFALLFETTFRRLNLAVLTRFQGESSPLQNPIAYSFYAFSTLGNGWHVIDEIYERLVLPVIRQLVTPGEYFDPLNHMVYGSILRPLEWLGLAEIEDSLRVGGHKKQPARVRKTPLFDRFLEFRLEPARQ